MYKLRINGYGKEVKMQIRIPKDTFVPHIKNILERKQFDYKETKGDLYFNLDQEQADSLFGEGQQIFHRMYGTVKVFAYSIQFVYWFKTNSLKVQFYVLQKDIAQPNSPILGFDLVNE